MGSGAKQKFWELYKSERKFKDFKPAQGISDPRFAYFKTCKDLKIQPKAGFLIHERETPYIDFTGQFMKSTSSVAAVAEAVKRYQYTVLGVNFVDNSLEPRQIKTIVDSFSHHFVSLQVLNMSENNVGLEGARHIALQAPQLKSLTELTLSGCNITDKGVQELLTAFEQSACFLQVLNLAGNAIGQSSFFE